MDSRPPRHKRLRRVESAGSARFVTFSTFRRLPLFQNDAIKDAFAGHLARARERHPFRLLAWVVMPEHVHLILLPADGRVSTPLAGLKRGFAREVIGRWRALNAPVLARITDSRSRHRFWQRGGGYDRNVRDEDELREKIAYIHHNPVERGLVERPADWAWSSARWYGGDLSGPVEIDPWS